MSRSDLYVDSFSNALAACSIDLVVSGSIGAVESVRFIRALRRIGASPKVWLTKGGSQFVTNTALAWASAQPIIENFTGDASHIALGDACVVAPASASIIGKIAQGLTDTPASALIASYLGQKKPVILIPNMNDSLIDSPFVQENLQRLRKFCHVLGARVEEGKQKFPDPAELADEVAQLINQGQRAHVLISMGTTRGYIDDVRYISNYSSGALGSKISEELYRQGFQTTVVSGPCPIKPRVATKLIPIETNQELEKACLNALQSGADAAILAASVLDFAPLKKQSGKISSKEDLAVEFVKTEKIIGKLHPRSGIKIGFKLEAQLDSVRARAIAEDYFARYQLQMMVLNALSELNEQEHRAFVVSKSQYSGSDLQMQVVDGKQEIALAITEFLKLNYNPQKHAT
ncbi:MAG: bifunctional phosphopantothenoylcysteine decarboxylase/phosphopantothenate--cysteine ligase CoaBC [Oligoflexus sp.]